MKRLLAIGGFIIVAALFVMLVLGWLQPVKHSVSRSIRLSQKPEAVFAILENTTNLPAWSSAVGHVDVLPDQNGQPTVRCILKWGGIQMIMTRVEDTPPSRLVVAMAKDDGTPLGTWTYEVSPTDEGCRVVLTEDGELKNPFFREMARLRGLDANIKQTLSDLSKRFGQEPDILMGP